MLFCLMPVIRMLSFVDCWLVFGVFGVLVCVACWRVRGLVCLSLAFGRWPLVFGHWSLAVGLWPLVFGHWSVVFWCFGVLVF